MPEGYPPQPQGPNAPGPGPYHQPQSPVVGGTDANPPSTAPPPQPGGPYAPPPQPGGPYAPPPQGYPPQGYPPAQPPGKSGKGCLIAGITFAVVFILLIAAVAYFVFAASRKVQGLASNVIEDGKAVSSMTIAETSERGYFRKNNFYTDDGAVLANFAPRGPSATPVPSGYPTGFGGGTVSYTKGTSPARNSVAVELCNTNGTLGASVLLQTQASGDKVIAMFLNSSGKTFYATGQQSCPTSDLPSSPWGTAQSSWGVFGMSTATPTTTPTTTSTRRR